MSIHRATLTPLAMDGKEGSGVVDEAHKFSGEPVV
jgi:hypothetical protein